MSRSLWILLSVSSAFGCVTLTTVNISQKTSLERQLMGELEPLTEEELLAASVRAGGSAAAGSLDDLHARAIAARRRQMFNRDDVDELKGKGCLGETKSATLVGRACAAASSEETKRLIDRVVLESNTDRAAIIDWAIAADPVLTPKDRPQVVGLYRELLREQAAKGEWLQMDDGTWAQK